MTVKCRICGDEIILNEDSEQARGQGTDPRQQLRIHLATHLEKTMLLGYRMGWLSDMLAFTCPTEPQRWRQNILLMLDWWMEQDLSSTRTAETWGSLEK